MRKLLLKFCRLYFYYFPIRKGKIPILLLIDKTGLTKHFKLISSFDGNTRIHLNLDDWIQKQIFYFGRYEIEKNETLFWRNVIKENQIVFDIGANIGYYSLQASVRVGQMGKVFSFEPVSLTYKKLISNIELNDFKNIFTEDIAISNKKGELELYVAGENSTGSSSISMHKDFSGIKEKVQTVTLDEYVYSKGITRVDIVKIDVEGSEPMVIEGMTSVMKEFKPVILIEVLDERLNTVGSSKELLYDLFYKNDYEAFEILNKSTLKAIKSPQEGGLIVFKHKQVKFKNEMTFQY